nr:uncharacterized protein LOC123750812 [Procambarus clarkii]
MPPSLPVPTEEPQYLAPDTLDPMNPLDLEPEDPDLMDLDPDSPVMTELRNTLWNKFMEQSTVLNSTDEDHKVLKCFQEYVHSIAEPSGYPGSCPVKFDGVSCWPETAPGALRVIPCFNVYNGVYYDPSGKFIPLPCTLTLVIID